MVYQTGYYKFIEGFRGVAILGVLIAHGTYFFHTYSFNNIIFKVLTLLGPIGHLGVDMFFVISGFLITGILIDDFSGKINLKRFYLRRAFKILPSYMVLILVSLIIFRSNSWPIEGGLIVPYLFLVQNYNSDIFPPLAHTWSLAIEEHFYIIYSLMVLIVFKISAQSHLRRQLLIVTCLALMGMIITFRDVLALKEVFNFAHPYDISVTSLYRLDALLFGCVLRLMEPYYTHHHDRLWRYLAPVSILSAASIYYVLMISVNADGNIVLRGKYFWAYLAAGLLFLGTYRGHPSVKRVFEFSWLRWIGRNSYGIYIWHFPIVGLLSLNNILSGQLRFLIFFILSLLVGYISTVTIERYALNLRAKLSP